MRGAKRGEMAERKREMIYMRRDVRVWAGSKKEDGMKR